MAVMASHSPESAVHDQKLPKTVSTVEHDGRNGSTEVNGHVSTPNGRTDSNSEDKLSAANEMVQGGDLAKTIVSQNEAAFVNNQTKSVEVQEEPQAPEAESAQPEGAGTTDVNMDDAPTDTVEAAATTQPTAPLEKKSSQEPTVSTDAPAPESPASEAPASGSPTNNPPSKGASPLGEREEAGQAAAGVLEVSNTSAATEKSNVEESGGTQDTFVGNSAASASADDFSLRPSISNLAINPSQVSSTAVESADVSMTDVPQSPLKMSREREEDVEEEPAAKRVKTDMQGDVVEVKALPKPVPEADKPDIEGEPLFNKDGEPKTLADASLEGNPITPWQARKIRGILAGIKKTKAGGAFKLPVEVMWPTLWPEYQAKVPEPVDIGTMEKRLKGGDTEYKPYRTLGDFKKDLQLLFDNSVRFNGEVHEVTKHAQTVRDQVLEKMAAEHAVEVVKTDKRETVKHHPSRHTAPRAPPQAPPPPARRPSKPVATSPTEKPAESPAFAIPPNNNGVPLIRRDSTKNADDRPKRPIHPPKNKDLGYEPKKKKKLSPDFRFCDEVLTELRKPKYYDLNQDFLAPVDPIALNIPNYHKIIKKPMDMQTMGEKLHSGQYNNPKEFEKDFSQIIKNCRVFNGDDHFVTQRAIELEKVFKREWAKKDDWMAKHAPATVAAPVSALSPHGRDDSDSDDAESEAEADDEKEQSSATLEALQRRLDEENDKLKDYMKSKHPDMGMVEVSQSLVVTLQRQIIQERLKLSAEGASSKKQKSKPTKSKKAAGSAKKTAGSAAGAGAGNAGGGGAGGASKRAGGGNKKAKRTIGALEKEVIASAIPTLDGDLLNRAIDIIKRDTNENENDSGELELDLEILSVDALLKLYDISVKAFPHLKSEKERNLAAPAATHDAAPTKSKSSKPKKNKPMSKAEQERRLQQLNELKASIKNRGSGSQEPIESIEGNGGAALSPNDVMAQGANDSDEESSEEE